MPHRGITLTSMKIDPKKLEERMKPQPIIGGDAPIYPYGLRVHLDEDALDALGLSTLPKVGAKLYLGANVKVVSVSDNEHTNDGGGTHRHRSVELQITEMGLTKGSAAKGDDEEPAADEKAGALYNPKESITVA